MEFNAALTDTVEILSPALVVDPYSTETTESWSDPTTRTVSNVLVYMGASNEEPTARNPNQVFTQLTAILPYGDHVTSRDRVRVLTGPYAGLYRVQGKPAHWRTPWSGWEGGTQVRIEETTGV